MAAGGEIQDFSLSSDRSGQRRSVHGAWFLLRNFRLLSFCWYWPQMLGTGKRNVRIGLLDVHDCNMVLRLGKSPRDLTSRPHGVQSGNPSRTGLKAFRIFPIAWTSQARASGHSCSLEI